MNAMIDHDITEKLKKLENEDFKDLHRIDRIRYESEKGSSGIWSYELFIRFDVVGLHNMTFTSLNSLDNCKLQAIEFLEGKSK